MKANGLIVFVPKYGIEGPIYLTEKQDKNSKQQQQPEQWLLDEERKTVRSADGRQSFTVFGKCAVRITVEERTGHRSLRLGSWCQKQSVWDEGWAWCGLQQGY